MIQFTMCYRRQHWDRPGALAIRLCKVVHMARLNKQKRRIWRVEDGRASRKVDQLAGEEPLEIRLQAGGAERTVAITMRTPGNDYELAAGFLYNEGLIQAKSEIVQMTYCVADDQSQEYNTLRIQLRQGELPELAQLERHFFTNSACGVCGRTMLDELATRVLPPLSTSLQVMPQLLTQLPDRLRQGQSLFESTGGLHAAALFSTTGDLVALREDVGRHNALDKLIGWGLLNRQLPFSEQILLVSGRASYELLHKCRVAGVPIFCAVSAPSTLAVELAERFGITLVGFLRGERFNLYTGVERVQLGD
jgi:FdhD protein